jgi:dihydroorotate dehydrogenase electron transfer subunit
MTDVFSCEIVENRRLTDRAFAVTVLSEDIAAAARPGQFVHVACGPGRLLRRPFGVCRAGDGKVVIIVEVKGAGTRWLSERRVGDGLDILGPLGNGFSMPGGGVLVVGGGLGVAPLLFAAEASKAADTPTVAVLGFRDSGAVILKDEFEAVCDKVFVATDDGGFGIHGNAPTVLAGLLEGGALCGGSGLSANNPCKAVLACGPRAMLARVADVCRRFGVPCQVSLEERMGCGVGACMVCACEMGGDGARRMSRVCKDGPVYDAAEVLW